MWKKDTRSPASSEYLSPDITAAAERSRQLLKRRALISAATSAVPIPGLDWAADAALLTRLIPRINAEFGLTPAQLDALSPSQREQVQKAINMVGSVLIGKLITRDMVLRLARLAGMRLSSKQAMKYVPLAGQVASAAMGYTAMRYLGERHIQDCIRVAQQAELDIPQRLARLREILEGRNSSGRPEHTGRSRSFKRQRKASWSEPDRGPWKSRSSR